MAFADECLEPGQFLGRASEVVGVTGLDREVLERLVGPVEVRVLPGGPGHELDGGHAQVAQFVESVDHRGQRRALPSVLEGEVVDHQLVDREVAVGTPTALERPDLVLLRGAASDHHTRVPVGEAAVPCTRIGHDPWCSLIELHEVLVLVESGGQVPSGDGQVLAVRGGAFSCQLEPAREIPVLPAQQVLEISGHANNLNAGIRSSGEEDPELHRPVVRVVAHLPGAAPLVHEDHACSPASGFIGSDRVRLS